MVQAPKILVADDQADILPVVAAALPSEVELLYALNGQVAVELARSEQPDLILMDWEMPVLSGMEAVQKLKTSPQTEEIPIIVHSGKRIEAKDLAEALDKGAVDFISKPFSRVELRARVFANLRMAQQHQQIKKLMQESLDRKNRALASSALEAYQQKKAFDGLLRELQKIAFDSPKEIRGRLNGLNGEIQERLKVPQSWKHFKHLFEEVHPRFFKELMRRYPDLTLTDHKIAAYLKIGLNVKDIASLNAVSPASVRRSLNRMKHKMGLSPEQGLAKVLLAL